MKTEKIFPNGFDDWQETHFEIVHAITQADMNGDSNTVNRLQEEQGHGGLYELAQELTDKFELMHEGKEWGIDNDTQYFDAMEEFLTKELY